MKKTMLISILFCVVLTCNAFASSPPWTGTGTYTFDDTDPYFVEDSIWDTATVNISGGSFGSLGSHHSSTINMFDGHGDGIAARDNSTVNLYGGNVGAIDILDSPSVNLFVDSYLFNADSYLGWDQLTGTWMDDNGSFDILIREGQFPLINMVPEPASLLLLATGGIFLRK